MTTQYRSDTDSDLVSEITKPNPEEPHRTCALGAQSPSSSPHVSAIHNPHITSVTPTRARTKTMDQQRIDDSPTQAATDAPRISGGSLPASPAFSSQSTISLHTGQSGVIPFALPGPLPQAGISGADVKGVDDPNAATTTSIPMTLMGHQSGVLGMGIDNPQITVPAQILAAAAAAAASQGVPVQMQVHFPMNIAFSSSTSSPSMLNLALHVLPRGSIAAPNQAIVPTQLQDGSISPALRLNASPVSPSPYTSNVASGTAASSSPVTPYPSAAAVTPQSHSVTPSVAALPASPSIAPSQSDPRRMSPSMSSSSPVSGIAAVATPSTSKQNGMGALIPMFYDPSTNTLYPIASSQLSVESPTMSAVSATHSQQSQIPILQQHPKHPQPQPQQQQQQQPPQSILLTPPFVSASGSASFPNNISLAEGQSNTASTHSTHAQQVLFSSTPFLGQSHCPGCSCDTCLMRRRNLGRPSCSGSNIDAQPSVGIVSGAPHHVHAEDAASWDSTSLCRACHPYGQSQETIQSQHISCSDLALTMGDAENHRRFSEGGSSVGGSFPEAQAGKTPGSLVIIPKPLPKSLDQEIPNGITSTPFSGSSTCAPGSMSQTGVSTSGSSTATSNGGGAAQHATRELSNSGSSSSLKSLVSNLFSPSPPTPAELVQDNTIMIRCPPSRSHPASHASNGAQPDDELFPMPIEFNARQRKSWKPGPIEPYPPLHKTDNSVALSQDVDFSRLPRGARLNPPRELWNSDPDLNIFTMAEVGRHCTEMSCWLVVKGVVYDVTAFIPYHPGGPRALIKFAGTDAEEHFKFHSKAAQKLWQKFEIGRLYGYEPESSCALG